MTARYFPARLTVRKATGGHLDILLVRPLGEGSWECLARGIGKGKDGRSRHDRGILCQHSSGSNDSWSISFAFRRSRLTRSYADWERCRCRPISSATGRTVTEDFDRYQTVYAENSRIDSRSYRRFSFLRPAYWVIYVRLASIS